MSYIIAGFEKKAQQLRARTYGPGQGPIDPKTGQRLKARTYGPGTTVEMANKQDLAQGAIPTKKLTPAMPKV